jgi:hypothetical protein
VGLGGVKTQRRANRREKYSFKIAEEMRAWHPRADIDGMALENGALMIEHGEKPALQLHPEPPVITP